MTTHPPSAVGIAEDLEQAEKAIEELRRTGFPPEEIGIVGHVGEPEVFPAPPEGKPPEQNATLGMIAGGIWGAVIGVLVILVVPGLGEVSGMGGWFEIVAGAALGGAAGGTLCALGSLPFIQPRARFFRRQLEKGRFIVTVSNPQRRDEAVSVLRHQGIQAVNGPDQPPGGA